MSDDDLARLGRTDVPPPRPGAMERGRDAGLHAFREEKNAAAPQGSGWLARLLSIFNTPMRRWTMEKRMVAGGALASVLVAVFAMQIYRDGAVPLSFGDLVPSSAPPAERSRDLQVGEPQRHTVAGDETDGGRQSEERPDRSLEADVVRQDAGIDVASGPVAAPAPLMEAAPSSILMRDQAQAQAPVARHRYSAAKVQRGIQPIADPAPEIVENRDRFEEFDAGAVNLVSDNPVATFSIDVDTASYAFVRRSINGGQLPPHDAVRVEEMINYFPYGYAVPASADEPFNTTVAVYPAPWKAENRLLHIGIKGYDLAPAERRQANLVFLVDVSGSMNAPDKLPLLKNALRLLVNALGAGDTVSIVTYAGQAGTVLEPTPVSEKSKILGALDRLGAGGSTAGAAGIEQAYALARQSFVADGVNRVILATDGDFNVGISDPDKLEEVIGTRRDSGIFLSILGFGQGNYNDALMQRLAQNGNGVAAYIDTLNEARKVLVEEAGSTLFPIARDVKIQVEFNPARVSEYRLIGYETRALAREDFNNDRVDAGDVGSGHAVTAIFEITPAGAGSGLIDERRYGTGTVGRAAGGPDGELAFVKLRYKRPEGSDSRLITRPVTDADGISDLASVPTDLRFAASVAAFGQKLRGGQYLGDFGYDEIVALANGARGSDRFGYRAEFTGLVRLANTLDSAGRR